MDALLDFQAQCLEAHDGLVDLEFGGEMIQFSATVYSDEVCDKFHAGQKYRVLVVEA